jgi:predicted Zn finger-like uncharacterized protein
MKTHCTHCQSEFDVEAADLGQTATCPECGQEFTVAEAARADTAADRHEATLSFLRNHKFSVAVESTKKEPLSVHIVDVDIPFVSLFWILFKSGICLVLIALVWWAIFAALGISLATFLLR